MSPLIIIGALVLLTNGYLVSRIVRGHIDAILWWPLMLYVAGPFGCLLVLIDNDFLSTRFSPESSMVVTVILSGSLLFYFIFLSKTFQTRINRELKHLSPTKNMWPMYLLGFTCMGLQSALLAKTGASIFSGSYVLGEGAFEENSTLFLLTSGFYEIYCALLAIRTLIVRDCYNKRFIIFSVVVILMRMFGGTRLIVMKTAIFTMLIFFLTGRISKKLALVSASVFVTLLLTVGALRGGSDDHSLAFLFLAEPALSSLSATTVVDFYQTENSTFNLLFPITFAGFLIFIGIHLLPGFIYNIIDGRLTYLGEWGYYRTAAESVYPFQHVLTGLGIDTISPVGGQSIAALGVVLFGLYGAPLVLSSVLSIFLVIKKIVPRRIPLLLIVGFEAPSIYRDSTEIFVKQVFVITIGYMIIEYLGRVALLKYNANSDR